MQTVYFERDLRVEFEADIGNDLILVLAGARQSGKTAFLRNLQEGLCKTRKCFFINLEDPEYLVLLNQHPDNLFKITGAPPKEPQTVVIDEVQYLDRPTNFLKYLYDEYRGSLKLIVSGSSSFYLDTKFKDSLAGRKRLFELRTLNFHEFLTFKGAAAMSGAAVRRGELGLMERRGLEPLLREYVSYGGYPAVVLAPEAQEKQRVLGELCADYVKKDVMEAGIHDAVKYQLMLKLLAKQSSLVNVNELASTLAVSRSTVEKYLQVMQKSFHAALIRPFYRNVRKELTKMPKAYFYDTGLRNHLSGSFAALDLRDDKGLLFETFLFRELLFRHKQESVKFWRTQSKNEVDFILEDKKAVEAKFSRAEVRPAKYKLFKEAYPGIPLDFVVFDEALDIALGLRRLSP